MSPCRIPFRMREPDYRLSSFMFVLISSVYYLALILLRALAIALSSLSAAALSALFRKWA